jgi:atypical dual specificity phosphatase
VILISFQGGVKSLYGMPTDTGNFAPQATEIARGLYISDYHTAHDPSTLHALRITHVISVVPGRLDPLPLPANQVLQIPVEDMPFVELLPYLDGAVRWIDRALRSHPEAKVLVHCFKGASRSSAVICAYLMKVKRYPLKDALAYLKSKRPIAEPNFGFVMQLQEYEKTL